MHVQQRTVNKFSQHLCFMQVTEGQNIMQPNRNHFNIQSHLIHTVDTQYKETLVLGQTIPFEQYSMLLSAVGKYNKMVFA